MLKARQLHPRPSASTATDEVVLDWDARRRHRFRTRLVNGEELGVILPRGTAVAEGDELETEDGRRVRVRAALEPLSIASAADPHLFARLAYHLGNRHVPLQIEPGRVLYRHDHVLDDLARRLGATVTFADAAFTPEGGAYGHGDAGHSHSHSHDHHHSHSHSHSHSHDHDHDHDHPHDHDHAHADDASG
jgi:urease accessory protein